MAEIKSKNIKWHETSVGQAAQEKQSGHAGVVLWFTGLSGSGKSTVANLVIQKLFETGHRIYILDADNLRHGLNQNLGFSLNDRLENIRRVGEVAKMFTFAGTIVSTALISPLKADREQVRQIFQKDDFIEIFVKCPLEVCEQRDPKGLYQKARRGEIEEFTGISSPYEEPPDAEITVHTDQDSLEDCVSQIIQYLKSKNFLRKDFKS